MTVFPSTDSQVTSAPKRHESFLLTVARDFKWALRAACLILLIATVVLMAVFFYAAIPTVILLLGCYVLLVMAEGVESRMEHESPGAIEAEAAASLRVSNEAQASPEAKRQNKKTRAIERRLTRISLEVLGGALVLAAGLGVWAFHWDWRVVPIAGLVLVCYCILVTAPMWLAWMEDNVERVVKADRRPV